MKNNCLLVSMALIAITLFSCSDMIDSDPNLSKTKIIDGPVKNDQEHNVIMPLRAGNYWIYHVSMIDPKNGSLMKEFYDTLKVIREGSINKEKWFYIKTMTYASNDIEYEWVANTAAGLWSYLDGVNEPYLKARYPAATGESYSFAWDHTPVGPYDNTVYYWTKTETADLNINNHVFNCVKYTKWLEYTNKGETKKIDPWLNEYYADGIGLVRKEEFGAFAAETVQVKVVYDLVKSNLLLSDTLEPNVKEIDMGSTPIGGSTAKAVPDIIINTTDESLIVYSITVTGANAEALKISHDMSLPIVIAPGEAMPKLLLSVTPMSQGQLDLMLVISTSKGNFNIRVKCVVV